jgi:acetolactate synthase-1/2/3 large subunit
MRVRPNPTEVDRAAKLLVDARKPLLIVGDEVYKAKAFDKVVQLAELLALPVTQARSVHASFPQQHPLWVGAIPGARVESLTYPTDVDLVINIGGKLQPNSAALLVSRKTKFIDLRNDGSSVGSVLRTDAPLVGDVAYGTDDLIAAVNQLLTPAIKQRIADRASEVHAFSAKARQLRALVSRNPLWDAGPMEADRVTYEVAQWADKDAIVVHEAGSVEIAHSFEFDPRGGRELFFYYGAHLGSGVGTAAGVSLARPENRSSAGRRWFVRLRADGAVEHGAAAASGHCRRLQQPRVQRTAQSRHRQPRRHRQIIDASKFVHDYLGKPNMDMAAIAKGFGVDGEHANNPTELKAALARAKRNAASGKPYLIDAQVARHGPGWTDDPWVPTRQTA